MQTTIDELWREMSTAAASDAAPVTGWALRLARPTAGCPLYAAVDLASGRRGVLLRLPASLLPPRQRWPNCKGMDPLTLRADGHEHFGVALKEERFRDVFAALAEDLARRVTIAATPEEQASAFLSQLARWQKFLASSVEGLSEEKQRGLWGELSFLRDHLYPAVGSAAVLGWRGPEEAHQDFQYPGGAVEVKTTLAKQPQIVRVTSERQLDESGWSRLILAVIALEVREGDGETLPQIVQSVRKLLTDDAATREQFEDGLLLYGYHDAHNHRYMSKGYLIRSSGTFNVNDHFPAIRERTLPPGVGNVSYGLSVAACAGFELDGAALASALSHLPTHQKESGE